MNNNRLMIFIDGSNLLVQLFKILNIELRADRPSRNSIDIARGLVNSYINANSNIIRVYWFSSYKGNDDHYNELRKNIRDFRMEPILFKKKGYREKGVDIALTKEVLVNAFNQNFDVGLLVAGDEDYVGLVHEVKRYGQIMHGTFFEEGLSNELKVEFDQFFNLSTELSSPKFDQLKNLLYEESHSNSKK